MKPIEFEEANLVLGASQPQYGNLPCFRDDSDMGDGEVVSCWKLSWLERVKILFGGVLWLRQLTFHSPLQPILPQVKCPFEEKTDG